MALQLYYLFEAYNHVQRAIDTLNIRAVEWCIKNGGAMPHFVIKSDGFATTLFKFNEYRMKQLKQLKQVLLLYLIYILIHKFILYPINTY